MNFRKMFVLAAGAALILTGCAAPAPKTAADGKSWSENWIMIGNRLGIEAPKGLTPLENKDILAAEGLYYATWTKGDSVPYENDDGDTVDLYDAQLYLVASESRSAEKAQDNMETWLAAARESYDVVSEDTVTCNGQEYTMLTYTIAKEDSPYERGVSAFGCYDAEAICVELTCVEDFSEELKPILIDFLDGCHYAAG